MLNINTTEGKEINFEVQIEGVSDLNQLKSFFRIVIDEIEYGFPCKVFKENMGVTIPPLDTVVGKKIKEGTEVEVKLEVVVDGTHLVPWHGTAKLSKPLVIEAKIKDPDSVEAPKVETKLITKDSKLKVIKEEKSTKSKKDMTIEEFKKNLKEEDIYKYMDRAGTKNKQIQDIIFEQASANSKTQEPIDILKNVVKIIQKKTN
ncbi:MAG: hypothetical protein ACFFG0_02175 [Candidatus Thorarchaeota archaeon]